MTRQCALNVILVEIETQLHNILLFVIYHTKNELVSYVPPLITYFTQVYRIAFQDIFSWCRYKISTKHFVL